MHLNGINFSRHLKRIEKVVEERNNGPLHHPQMPEMWKVGINHGL